tara:strand:- start:1646 stop:2587 length:942 start_codon:yes stop_codon:yes gene_type:complete
MVKITIGILTVPLSKHEYYVYKKNRNTYFNSYLPTSYVKWLEQSGAKVVPIPFNLSEKKILEILKQVNGVLFPGGDVDRNSKSDFKKYVKSFKQIFNYAVKENDKKNVFPLWATCLGFEFLCMMPYDVDTIIHNYKNHFLIKKVASRNRNVKFNLYKNVKNPLGELDKNNKVTNNAKIYMNHHYGFLLNKETTSVLTKYLDIISINKDKNRKEYISTIKFKKYPFWGVQWHPEKVAYEHNDTHVENSMENINFSSLWSEFFIYLCMKSENYLKDKNLLINNFPLHRGKDIHNIKKNKQLPKYKTIFMQNYFFV